MMVWLTLPLAWMLQVRVAYDVFMLSGVLEELAIPESELTGFLSAVSAHYHSPDDVPYHNLAHVVQVLHAVWLVSRPMTPDCSAHQGPA